jgi:hypothetical protein
MSRTIHRICPGQADTNSTTAEGISWTVMLNYRWFSQLFH